MAMLAKLLDTAAGDSVEHRAIQEELWHRQINSAPIRRHTYFSPQKSEAGPSSVSTRMARHILNSNPSYAQRRQERARTNSGRESERARPDLGKDML
jgi:hypothetical protein